LSFKTTGISRWGGGLLYYEKHFHSYISEYHLDRKFAWSMARFFEREKRQKRCAGIPISAF
jgi:hypothetical protein